MDINNDIFILNESEVSTLSETKPEPIKDSGLVEQVVKSENARLTGADEIRITESPYIIGKDETCDFTIRGDTYISRKHARIFKRGTEYFIEDLDSTNGTFIDGKPAVGKVKLEVGQEVMLADRHYVWQE